MDEREILARVDAAPARRWLAIGVLVALAVLLLSLVVDSPTGGVLGRVLLLLTTAAVGWMAYGLWEATRVGLILTRDGIEDDTGAVLATMDAIEKVERGAFAFKPSNGFLLVLREPMERHWAPGLWWRLGRRVGVGGVCGAGQTKAMADILAMELSREAD